MSLTGHKIHGSLLGDTLLAADLQDSLANIRQSTKNTQKLTNDLDDLVNQIHADLAAGKESLHLLLRDSVTAGRTRKSLDNIEQGTDGFNQNMEALKHNFLFRGY